MEFIRTPKVEKVRFMYPYPTGSNESTTVGTLYLTATHLIFVDPYLRRETWILHSLIASVEKLPITAMGSPLLMRCKHFLCITFVIPREKEAHDIYQSLIQLSQPTRIEQLYCFFYTASNEYFKKSQGWSKFSLENEYKRMGAPNADWTITSLNLNYKLCETYPPLLLVPSKATDEVIKSSSRFRSKQRVPVCSYLFRNKASICRCAQPLSGFRMRCMEDEALLECIRNTNPNSNFLYLIDTRPMINAVANKAQGKGYENKEYYENIKFHFFGIENIHVMRGSLQKLIDACELRMPMMNSFLKGVEGSGWLRHVKSILETSRFIANAVNQGTSVVVHCSDGWDRTSQTCAIASLILDPYYRTIDGFQALIEKEWLAFGHKFSDRCGHVGGDSKEMAPVFTQFLDVIWQIMQQHPCAFEFNERFLITINDCVYNVQFGTFVGNSPKEREQLRLSERTHSLWAFLDAHRSEYINSLYEPFDGVLPISVAPQLIKFWRGLFNRFEVGVHPRDLLEDVLTAKKNHVDALKCHVDYLETYLTRLNEGKNNQNGVMTTKPSVKLGSIDLDDIDRPMRVVEECMQRLEMKHQLNVKLMDEGKVSSDEESNNVESNSISEPLAGDEERNSKEPSDDEATPNRPTSLNLPVKEAKNPFDDSLDSTEYPTVDQVIQQCELISLNWQTFQNLKDCVCSTPLEIYSSKLHCYACGLIYCIRCIDKRCVIPCDQSNIPRPVCRSCFMKITKSSSFEA